MKFFDCWRIFFVSFQREMNFYQQSITLSSSRLPSPPPLIHKLSLIDWSVIFPFFTHRSQYKYFFLYPHGEKMRTARETKTDAISNTKNAYRIMAPCRWNDNLHKIKLAAFLFLLFRSRFWKTYDTARCMHYGRTNNHNKEQGWFHVNDSQRDATSGINMKIEFIEHAQRHKQQKCSFKSYNLWAYNWTCYAKLTVSRWFRFTLENGKKVVRDRWNED